MPLPVDPRDPRLVEAMSHFDRYHQPELAGLLAEQGLPVGGLIADQRARIRDEIVRGAIALPEAWAYIDRVEESGQQSIFLFRPIAGEGHELLAALADPEQLRARLLAYAQAWEVRSPVADESERAQPEAAPATLREQLERETSPAAPAGDEPEAGAIRLVDRFVFRAAEPELAAAVLRTGPIRHLLLELVAARRWQARIRINGGFTYEDRSERAASFVVFDLGDRHAEIRIRRLRPRPELSLREELERHLDELRRLLGSFPFEPVLLEPVARRLLLSPRARAAAPRLAVTAWRVDVAGEGPLRGRVNPSFLQKVLLALAHVTAVQVTGDWRLVTRRASARIVLDARSDTVRVRDRIGTEDLRAVVRKILRRRSRKLRIDAVKKVAAERPPWRATLAKYDQVLHDGRQDRVTVDRMAQASWRPEAEALAVAEALRAQDPETFGLAYYVRCPDTGKAVRQKGRAARFQSADEIPDEIRCEHVRPRQVAFHATEGNVVAELVYRRAKERRRGPQLLPVVARSLRVVLPPAVVDLIFPIVALLIFLVLFTATIGGASWVFSAVAEAYPEHRVLPYLGFALVLFLGSGIVVKVLGPPATTLTLKVLHGITDLVRMMLGLGPGKEAGDGVALDADGDDDEGGR